MYKLNDWNENEEFSPRKDAILASKNRINTSCCIDTTKTSCCIDTTKE